ncbi:hypothetical protein BOH66_02665 [Microbacterium aurum]|uniref:Uncharacterized protein n=1 Tax=Microbacterium aurum TaxID=36805 RepID=A0A1P8U5B5_9MICO|nr:hypothetical protein BOH66_02665 [Microbacterium aurum]MBM7826932.1 hypothetical protein [Microbacterium aurum]
MWDATAPVPVTAWVPHRVAYVDALAIEAEVIAWTQRAVLVGWILSGLAHPIHVWLWAMRCSVGSDSFEGRTLIR